MRPHVLVFTVVLGACVPLHPQETGADHVDDWDDGGDDGSDHVDGAYSGIVDDEPFSVEWWLGETWEQGGCVNLLVRLTGDHDVSSWSLELELDEAVESWQYGGGGAAVRHDGGDDVVISPYSSQLGAGQTLEMSYCAEPLARPDHLDATYELDDDDDDDDDDHDDDIDYSDVDTEGSLKASDDSVLLFYEVYGSWGYEACVDFLLLNTSGSTWQSWSAELTFLEDVDVIRADGYTAATLDSDSLLLLPEGGGSVADGSSASGQVCFEEASPPVYVRVDG